MSRVLSPKIGHLHRRRRRGALKGGIGTVVIVLAVSYFLGIDPSVILQMQQGTGVTTTSTDWKPTQAEQQAADFVSVVLADTEDTWNAIFKKAGQESGPVSDSGPDSEHFSPRSIDTPRISWDATMRDPAFLQASREG